MNISFLFVGGLGLLITFVCVFLLIKLPTKFWIKFLLVPLICLLGFVSFTSIPTIMGYPYDGVPKGKFHLVGAAVRDGEQGKGRKIEFWADQDGKSRLYSIPFDAKILKQMLDAMKADGGGNGQTDLEFKKNAHGGGTGDVQAFSLEGSFTPLVKTLPPKDKTPQPPVPQTPSY